MPKCLYNGVPLPVLPDWDKAAYPCIYIVAGAWVDGRYSGGYALIACETECIVSRANDGSICFGSLGSKYELYSLDEAVTAWEYENVFSFTGYLLASPVWVNVNVYYDADNGGALYLAASEPIPVGATPDIDPTSMFMGWLTGRRIAGQRRKGVES